MSQIDHGARRKAIDHGPTQGDRSRRPTHDPHTTDIRSTPVSAAHSARDGSALCGFQRHFSAVVTSGGVRGHAAPSYVPALARVGATPPLPAALLRQP